MMSGIGRDSREVTQLSPQGSQDRILKPIPIVVADHIAFDVAHIDPAAPSTCHRRLTTLRISCERTPTSSKKRIEFSDLTMRTNLLLPQRSSTSFAC